MSKKKKEVSEMTRAEILAEKDRIDKEWRKINSIEEDPEEQPEEETYTTSQPIYNYFQFFIGGPNNVAKNKQQGKPTIPPY